MPRAENTKTGQMPTEVDKDNCRGAKHRKIRRMPRAERGKQKK